LAVPVVIAVVSSLKATVIERFADEFAVVKAALANVAPEFALTYAEPTNDE
jgi:hypothetical protein